MDQQRPTREEWIALRIEAAMAQLMRLDHCPECNHTQEQGSVIGRVPSDYMEVRVTHCEHPWHLVPLCDGDPWLMAIGLPNKPHLDKLGTERSLSRVLDYALKNKLKARV